jgi:hypothetical protein
VRGQHCRGRRKSKILRNHKVRELLFLRWERQHQDELRQAREQRG